MPDKKVVLRRSRNGTTTPAPEPVRTVDDRWTTLDFVRRTDFGFIGGPQRRNAVIGIDQSVNRYAIAAVCPDDMTACIWLFKNPSGAKAMAGVKRMLALEKYVDTILLNLNLRCPEIQHVCMEGYNRAARNWREEAGELSWLTRRKLIERLGVMNIVAYPTIVAPSTLKKFITGNGHADKNLILKAVLQKWGLDVDDDNEADAYGLARMAAAIVTGQTAHKYEHEIVAKIGRHTEWDPQEPPKRPSRSSERVKTQSSG